MKILRSSDVKEVDAYTIENEPIHSINLMERAAGTISGWINKHFRVEQKVFIFIGPGNNGGDGLAIGRQLADYKFNVKLFWIKITDKLSPDAGINYNRLKKQGKVEISEITDASQIPETHPDDIILDGIFGSGLNRPLEGFPAKVVQKLNEMEGIKIAIDTPSGLFGEDNSGNHYDSIFKVDYTFTFQFPTLSFFFPEHQDFVGKWKIMDIGLSQKKIDEIESYYYLITKKEVSNHIKKRKRFDHKGKYGHVLIITGGYGKMGAAVLTSNAALRTGSGLVTTHVPKLGYEIMQTALPEAMISIDLSDIIFSESPETDRFSCVGIGPGIGTKSNTQKALKSLINEEKRPMVIDADALNILAQNKEWLDILPENSILTPHPKEFERLTEPAENHYERLEMQRNFAQKYKVYLVLKGGNTTIAGPEGNLYFNASGNPGMATAGSGDVLTGMITSLLGQGYDPKRAAITGVYLHGLAGDLAVAELGEETCIASDIIHYIGKAFKYLKNETLICSMHTKGNE